MRRTDQASGRRGGFSLVEVVVVVGIVAVLVAILLPTLIRAREQATLVQCEGNLRQLYVATQNYAVDNHDHYPDAFDLPALGITSACGGCVLSRGDGVVDPANPADGPSAVGLPHTYAIGHYVPAGSKVWVCPGEPDTWAAWGNTYLCGLTIVTPFGPSISRERAPYHHSPGWPAFWRYPIFYCDYAFLPCRNNQPNTPISYAAPVAGGGRWTFPHAVGGGVQTANGSSNVTTPFYTATRRNSSMAVYCDGAVLPLTAAMQAAHTIRRR